MIDKERLEEIKEFVKHADGDLTAQLFGFDIRPEAIVDDFNWLIEQAERAEKNAQDLEDMDKQLASEQKRIQELEERNKRLSEALEVENELHYKASNDVAELDERVHDLKIMLKVLGKKNQRYKQALEFYADDNNYKRIKTIATNIDMDNGKKAREALGDKQ